MGIYIDPKTRTEIVQLRRKFYLRLPEKIQKMREKMEFNDFDSAWKICHEEKGASGSCGFYKLHDVLSEIDQALKEHDTGHFKLLCGDLERTLPLEDPNILSKKFIKQIAG